ncbi:hypothetical protein QF015_003315 [Paenarthrobacter sp. TE4293]|uniref:heparin lyase I family protein n=1 Tax=Paenarthrobacter sp. TE4293 TaxID=3381695 RepID=UPI003D1D12B7
MDNDSKIHPKRRHHKRHLAAFVLAGAFSLSLVSPASAATIWDGDASQGTGVFRGTECEDPGTLTTPTQTDGHGTVFRFAKGSTEWRCEGRGIRVGANPYTFVENSTYYLGWESKLDQVSLPGGGDFVVFQWKSYPDADQNYPVLMTVANGNVRLHYVAPGGTWQQIWSKPIAAFDWHKFALGIHTSTSATDGWIELWFDGVKQTFSNGQQRFVGRTWDSANEPKWGVYDRDNVTDQIVNRVDSLRVGTTYADVD